MTTQRWKILDADEDLQSGPLHLDASHVAGAPAGFSVRHIIHRGGLSAGVDELRIHNGRLAFAVLPTRGMGIWKAWWDDRLEIGWRSPVRGPVHPRFVPVAEPSGLGWLDGFDELLCRCGAFSNGAPDFDAQGRLLYPLHGRIANRPAQRVEIAIEGDQITVTGVVQEVRFHFAKLQLTTRITTRFDQPSLQIDDQVQNLSASAGEMQMLYHINFGVPLLGAGAQLVAPVDTVVPRTPWAAESIDQWQTYEAPRPGRAERVYFCRLRGRLGRHPRAAQGPTVHPRRQPGLERPPVALLHAVEERNGDRRWVRDRVGTRDELPQPAQLRSATWSRRETRRRQELRHPARAVGARLRSGRCGRRSGRRRVASVHSAHRASNAPRYLSTKQASGSVVTRSEFL